MQSHSSTTDLCLNSVQYHGSTIDLSVSVYVFNVSYSHTHCPSFPVQCHFLRGYGKLIMTDNGLALAVAQVKYSELEHTSSRRTNRLPIGFILPQY